MYHKSLHGGGDLVHDKLQYRIAFASMAACHHMKLLDLVQVMELAQGGSLLDYVRQRKRLAEPEACFFLQQIVHGLLHCHSMEVCNKTQVCSCSVSCQLVQASC